MNRYCIEPGLVIKFRCKKKEPYYENLHTIWGLKIILNENKQTKISKDKTKIKCECDRKFKKSYMTHKDNLYEFESDEDALLFHEVI